MTATTKQTSPLGWVILAAFVVLCVGGGALIGTRNVPGEWYAALNQPFFTPPNWLFAPVWTILYAMVGVAGWRTWQRGYKGLAMQVWFLQLAINFTWSPVFFGMHQLGLALLIIGIMVVLTVIFMRLVWRSDRTTALLMAPYLAWISFASLLNGAFWWLN